jgi:SanA protein
MFFQRVGRVLIALTKVLFVVVVVAALLPFAVRGLVTLWARPFTYEVDDVPARRVALVLGAQVYSSGRLSAMLADRVAMATDLYEAGEVDLLLMSGDNSSAGYNEPDAMRDYAIRLGVPADAVAVDYGGRRTYDSCYRARHIFRVDDAVVVTQEFHLPRALMLCRGLGIDAVGVAADAQRPWGYSRRSMAYSRTRELPATLLALVDVVRRPLPPVMGEPIPLFPAEGID